LGYVVNESFNCCVECGFYFWLNVEFFFVDILYEEVVVWRRWRNWKKSGVGCSV